MSAHLSRLRLFQRHLRSLVWVWVWVWDWLHSHTPPRTRSPSSRHPPFTHYPFPLRSLVCGGQPSPHKPRLVVSHSTCPPLSSSPHANSFVLGTAVINTHENLVFVVCQGLQEDEPVGKATATPKETDGFLRRLLAACVPSPRKRRSPRHELPLQRRSVQKKQEN
jgi:hypothetical protein